MLWYGPRGGVVCAARWVRASGLDLGPPGDTHSPAVFGPLGSARGPSPSPRGVSENAQSPFPGAARAQAVRRSGARRPASPTSSSFHHLCCGPPTLAAPPLRCLPRLSPSTSGFQPLFPRELASLTLHLVGT